MKKRIFWGIVTYLIVNYFYAWRIGMFGRAKQINEFQETQGIRLPVKEILSYCFTGEMPHIQSTEDECYDASGTPLLYGRCDTCGAPCTPMGCMTDPAHDLL